MFTETNCFNGTFNKIHLLETKVHCILFWLWKDTPEILRIDITIVPFVWMLHAIDVESK